MAGNHYLDAGPQYDTDTPQKLRAQERFDKAEADRAAFQELGRKWADEALALAAARKVEPSGYFLKIAQERGETFPDFARGSLADHACEFFHLPDPQDEYDHEMGEIE